MTINCPLSAMIMIVVVVVAVLPQVEATILQTTAAVDVLVFRRCYCRAVVGDAVGRTELVLDLI